LTIPDKSDGRSILRSPPAINTTGTANATPRRDHAKGPVLSGAGYVVDRRDESGADSALSGLSRLRKSGLLIGLVRGQMLFEAQAVELSAQPGEMVGVETEERLTTPWSRSLRFRHPWLQVNLFWQPY